LCCIIKKPFVPEKLDFTNKGVPDMNQLIIYYSYSGKTKKIAEDLANKESADIYEIKDIRPPGKLKAYTAGIVASIRGKAWRIKPPDIEISKYDKITMLAPVWADNPPPAFTAMLEYLPAGKPVSVIMVSASGKSNCKDRLESIIQCKGCTLESLEDIKV